MSLFGVSEVRSWWDYDYRYGNEDPRIEDARRDARDLARRLFRTEEERRTAFPTLFDATLARRSKP